MHHRQRLEDHERRLSIIETVIGTPTGGGLLSKMEALDGKIDTLLTSIHTLQLQNAMASGAVKGASWVGYVVWSVIGSSITGGIVYLITKGAH
jgi:hypothetical protein